MVEQLRREAAIKRINVSQAIEDIKVKKIFCFDLNPLQNRGKIQIRIFDNSRNTYLTTRTRITSWWDFLPKSPTPSERSRPAKCSEKAHGSLFII